MTPVERTKSLILLQPLSLCREPGKGCARFPVHRGYRHYLRLNYLRRVLPIVAHGTG